jgi:hypothetical protein
VAVSFFEVRAKPWKAEGQVIDMPNKSFKYNKLKGATLAEWLGLKR